MKLQAVSGRAMSALAPRWAGGGRLGEPPAWGELATALLEGLDVVEDVGLGRTLSPSRASSWCLTQGKHSSGEGKSRGWGPCTRPASRLRGLEHPHGAGERQALRPALLSSRFPPAFQECLWQECSALAAGRTSSLGHGARGPRGSGCHRSRQVGRSWRGQRELAAAGGVLGTPNPSLAWLQVLQVEVWGSLGWDAPGISPCMAALAFALPFPGAFSWSGQGLAAESGESCSQRGMERGSDLWKLGLGCVPSFQDLAPYPEPLACKPCSWGRTRALLQH